MSRRWRSALFAPAVRDDLIAKLGASRADLVIIDCEDGSPADAKDLARANARRLAPTVGEGRAVWVRVNGPGSTEHELDFELALSVELAGVVVPKLETLQQIEHCVALLDRSGLTEIAIMAGIETVLGAADARSLLAHPRVTAAYFGAEDYVADLGGVRTETNAEVALPRAQVAQAARLGGVACFDQIVVAYNDGLRFEREVSTARALGYSGKMCIHPAQVDLANTGFTPGPDEIDRARRLLAAAAEGRRHGLGAVGFEGQMIDAPLIAQAEAIMGAVDGA